MEPENHSTKSSGNVMRVGLIGSALILAAAIAFSFYQEKYSEQNDLDSTTEMSAAESAPIAGETAPGRSAAPATALTLPENLMNANIYMLDGRKKRLADYSGKVLIVDLWATWCGPCRQEIPHLVQIAKDYKSKGVEVIGLTNEDPMSDAQMVKDFSKEYRINYPIGWADASMQMGLTRGRGVIPQTFIIGRDGKIRNHFIGFNAAISVPQMKAAIEAAVSAG